MGSKPPPASGKALAEHAGMQIAGNRAAAVCLGDKFKRHRQTAGMVPVPMREHHGVDAGEVDTQPGPIVLDRELHRAGVEQNRVALFSAECFDDDR
jgi:hypothetical protein